ncbi:hypothetical protein [Streptomyces sp. N50]|uniref:hypothetical protein n=1 Tax=Streptomyces sp. N50 TaxID=3081765 RepID=UPI00296238AC|nr:hypothetical protein [Streptomyces sp. N50]WOX14181.1 hypothetical protein R2B38_37470 [Streptomyces sp. N50]
MRLGPFQELTADQAGFRDRLVTRRGGVHGPFEFLLRSPRLGERAEAGHLPACRGRASACSSGADLGVEGGTHGMPTGVALRDADALRARLRTTTPAGVPLLTEATARFASYLTAERALGRITQDADIDTLARTLIGAGHRTGDRGLSPRGDHGRRRRPAAPGSRPAPPLAVAAPGVNREP